VRTVAPGFAETFDAVRATGVYDALIGEGLLVAHRELDPATAPEPAHALLEPDRIAFISHPYEWSPSQLRAAALHTLRVADVCLDHGVVLRDASAYNVQFVGTRPVFIDTLSFEPRVEDAPWRAYGQFCRHFLAPLALQTLVDHRLADLLRTNIDGVPLDLASSLLPWRTRLRPGLLTHIHAHASASARGQADPDAEQRRATMSDRALLGLIDSLRGTVRGLEWSGTGTTWADYYTEAAHYTDASLATKDEVVGDFVARIAPGTVFDLGANTGRFSRVTAATGADVIALDIDHGAVENAYRDLVERPPSSGSILPLRYDLANPSPGIGWATSERESLVERGPADLGLALALIHHVAIGNNVPLSMIAAHLAQLCRSLVIEWVPIDDPKVRVLLATRDRGYDDYDYDAFLAAFGVWFDDVDAVALPGSGRRLHLMRAR
jgi:ribosomal protein L11 methylase PrmA